MRKKDVLLSYEKEPERLLLRFARMGHRQRHIEKIKVFLLLFVHKKKAFCP